MWEKWFSVNFSEFFMILLSAVCVYAIVILYTRIVGLRSFSKMSAADFVMTVAIGSLLGGSIAAPSPTVLMAAVALAGLYGAQWLVAHLRVRDPKFSKIIDNNPILLMNGSQILDQNLVEANVTRQDLNAKLREANVWSYTQVLAVVFETTGNISVLHKQTESEPAIDAAIFTDVQYAEHLQQKV